MLDEKLITVFTTVYNIAQYLPRFFECMASQTFSDYVLLMVDDGSTDNSLDICKEYASRDARIQIIELSHKGISAARNVALASIETPFVASADGDDIYEKDYLLHLIKAQKKYDADLVISRVAYRNESYDLTGEFVKRGEKLIERKHFQDEIPQLLQERRLNYLYGKIYRNEFLKDIRVEEDVRQGSDTMINCQYIAKINRIVLIDDLDTNYIKYPSRSVTSYNGDDMFDRLVRINCYIESTFQDAGLLNERMQNSIDERILLAGIWVMDVVAQRNERKQRKYAHAYSIVNSESYLTAYNRQKQRDLLDEYAFHPVEPGEERKYIDKVYGEICYERRHELVHKYVPQRIVTLYHTLKKMRTKR